MKVDLRQTEEIIEKYRDKKGSLIPLLQAIEASYGYVPKESIGLVSKELSIFPVEIYGIVTFYTQFHLTRRGRHTIRVCQGTACHVMGGKDILDYLSDNLEIKEGETTKDGMFSLERVACLGACALSPVMMIDKIYYGKMTSQKAKALLARMNKAEKETT